MKDRLEQLKAVSSVQETLRFLYSSVFLPCLYAHLEEPLKKKIDFKRKEAKILL